MSLVLLNFIKGFGKASSDSPISSTQLSISPASYLGFNFIFNILIKYSNSFLIILIKD